MALRTGNRRVHPRQRVMRIKRVIELRIEPVGGCVAIAAVMRQPQLHVWRVVGSGKIGGVACIAGSRRSREDIVDMAGCTRQRGMHPGQCESGHLQMVELRVEPDVHGMAGFAGNRKAERYVIENRGQEVLLMAGIAVGR